jgi:uncharacterized protein
VQTLEVAVPEAQTLRTTTPRLLSGAHGWWFVGDRGSYLLSPGAVRPDGSLHPIIEEELSAGRAFDGTPPSAYSLTVLTSTACNLGCGYCFQNTGPDPGGGSRPPRIANIRLRPQTARAILDFTARQMAAAALVRLDLLLFGGEPLLNPRGCLELLKLAGSRGLRFARMTSNGVLLTPRLARELGDLGLSAVQITFDGARVDHDAIRVRRSGGGTFDVILANIAAASEATNLRWNLRVNVSHHNHRRMAGLIEQIASRVDPARCTIGFSLVDDVGVGYENNLPHDRDLAASFAEWSLHALDLGFLIVRPKAASRCLSCSFAPGRFGAVVNADGTLYSCWDSAGQDGWAVGDVRDGYLPDERIADRWVSCGYAADSPDARPTGGSFRDLADAALLDRLYASGRL